MHKIVWMFVFALSQLLCYAKQVVVTNPEFRPIDGFGAQFQNIIYSAIYAELQGLEFIYTPFRDMAHNYDSDPDFIAKKEWLINLKDNFEINRRFNAYRLDPHVVIKFFEKNLIACTQSDSLKKIKKVFRANKNIRDYFGNGYVNIAVHIRRFNPHDVRTMGTNTPDTVFLYVINTLRALYHEEKPLFHIYSQGPRENFAQFNASDIILHLNESIEDTFTALVLADALVTSASSFSYTAGILSDGTVYYMPFWHPPLSGWISLDRF